MFIYQERKISKLFKSTEKLNLPDIGGEKARAILEKRLVLFIYSTGRDGYR